MSMTSTEAGLTALRAFLWTVALLALPAIAAFDPTYPVTAGQHKLVQSSSFANCKYDVYLPTSYSATNRLPLLITFAPGGGGEVDVFKQVAEELQVIVIGNIVSGNGVSISKITGPDSYAMLFDLHHRVNFDPTAVFSAGFSGGGLMAYEYTKFCRPHLCGVLPMGGWLQQEYSLQDRFLDGLLVARTTGDGDAASIYWLIADQYHLSKYDVIVCD